MPAEREHLTLSFAAYQVGPESDSLRTVLIIGDLFGQKGSRINEELFQGPYRYLSCWAEKSDGPSPDHDAREKKAGLSAVR